jgi:hypothetical protein
MKTLVSVFIGMTSAFLAESCQGDRTQGQQSVIKTAKSTVEVHSVWHDIYVATETGGHMRAVVYYSVRLRKRDRERARDLRRVAQILPQQFFREYAKPQCGNSRTRRVCCGNKKYRYLSFVMMQWNRLQCRSESNDPRVWHDTKDWT